ncbi:MAG: hypothetical protein Q7T86_11115 [Hyphomicrobiaceae bacterium]|nr:hypothetical protein [Hyphomicrobiaceae bacterium]
MYMLVLQTFLLMLAAFVLGAALACVFKRSLHRFAGDDLPDDTLHVDVPPVVQRSAAVAAATTAAPVVVTRAEAQRFERALTGDVAEAPVQQANVRQAGPVIEVQPLPVPPPPPPPAPEAPPPYAEEVPLQPEPEPDAPLDIPLVSRQDDPEATNSIEFAEGTLTDGDTYNAIAVASHDGSMLPPPAIVEADLPPPQMPGPAPEPLPVPRVAIPTPQRPQDAPEPPHQTYIDEAIAAGVAYVPQPEAPAVDFELPVPADPDDFSVPPEGQTYASVALGGAGAAPATSVPLELEPEPAPEDERVIETKATHVATALAAAAGIAAERASGAGGAGEADDLTRIHGIDQVLAARLNYAGVTRFAEIASWNADDVRRMSQTLGFFGRIQDEYWIDQARLLAGGAQDAPPPAAEAPRHATPAGAADIATAAAAAAAAAMVASYSRPAPQTDAPPRPAKLADAIRENTDSAEHSAAAAPTDGEAEPEDDNAEPGSRSGLTGLRSVRAEALLGDDAEFVRGALDDLKRIRGIGVLIEKKLNSLGITSYEQVANWSASDVERISEVLDFKGRIERENWIEQARILASGGQTEFSRRVDRGEV